MISEEEYEYFETVHLLRSPANAARLLRSIRQADEGNLTERELIEPANEVDRQAIGGIAGPTEVYSLAFSR